MVIRMYFSDGKYVNNFSAWFHLNVYMCVVQQTQLQVIGYS